MKKTNIFLNVLLLSATATVNAQHSGNNVYSQNSGIQGPGRAAKLALTDSTFLIEASVAMNVIADSYVATFGLAEESSTLKECNDKIDKRIQSFVSELAKHGYSQADLYVDMTTQNKVYDYKSADNIAEQYLKGFEIKKNVIIRLKNIKDLDQLMISASNYQIYDLVKVDYIVTDPGKVYGQLFQAATEVINQKKILYTNATNTKLAAASQIYGEQFSSYYPDQLYKSYVAGESSEIYNNYNNYTKKDLRKSATFYYDKIDYSGFDKVINPAVTEPAVEFVLTLQIKYQVERAKK